MERIHWQQQGVSIGSLSKALGNLPSGELWVAFKTNGLRNQLFTLEECLMPSFDW